MAKTFDEITARTRDWLNRDTDVISDVILKNCIRWAADHAYRKLRIPPLEFTQDYSLSGVGAVNLLQEPSIGGWRTVTSFAVPEDLIEVIKISTLDSGGQTKRVIQNKEDPRTFFDPRTRHWGYDTSWTRQAGRYYVATEVGYEDETTVQLLYYRRLAALDATYSVVATNYNSGGSYMRLADVQEGPAVVDAEGFLRIFDVKMQPVVSDPPEDAAVFAPGNVATETSATEANPLIGVYKFAGKIPDNWLLNENERLLTYGGLTEAFSYVQEDDQAAKYKQLFMEEITELNDEDVKRNATGGNLQTNFNGFGLL